MPRRDAPPHKRKTAPARSPNPDQAYFELQIKSFTTLLSRWAGGQGEMNELTPSHRTLRIVIRRTDKPREFLVVACLDPEVIHGPVRWTNASLAVERLAPGNRGDSDFVVWDEAAGLRVLCGAVEVAEHQLPAVYRPPR